MSVIVIAHIYKHVCIQIPLRRLPKTTEILFDKHLIFLDSYAKQSACDERTHSRIQTSCVSCIPEYLYEYTHTRVPYITICMQSARETIGMPENRVYEPSCCVCDFTLDFFSLVFIRNITHQRFLKIFYL